ncbi:inositol-1-monophosphatase [Oxobacter pfennigii]|uniref:inositol-phosphate phosphatase n=1 Tax=Oxobacter pfennigii TaxID=36849 RepID=A0A0P8Y7R3_9CLOT|nr:inositol monophosphatase family protein [Oxobacter pfennigii]KPU42585.1 inositol-1-monophosphatase [Oxobacter pfennigii]
MKADLHVHTDISDGSESFKEIIIKAKDNGITHVGITNHDTVRCLKEAIEYGKMTGVKVIPGIEISACDSVKNKKVHILGYNFNLEGENIKKLCDAVLIRRQANSIRQINNLIRYGYDIDLERIFKNAKVSGIVYKQHIMTGLTDRNYSHPSFRELYEKLFKNRGICDMDIEYADVYEAVRAVKSDGGIAVLAHPGQLDSYYLIESLVDAGLDGIELYHEDHDEEDVERVLYYGRKHGLILTGGSDYHGCYGTEIKVGDINSPENYLHHFDKNIKPQSGTLKTTAESCDYEDILEFAEDIIRAAGKSLRECVDKECALEFKNGDFRDIVTKYDVETEEFLKAKLSEKFPAHNFITEESSCNAGCLEGFTWIIDPIDGTVNFVSIGKEFAISAALYKDNKPVLGIVYDVMKDEMYTAVCGCGAFLNKKALGKVNANCTLKDSLIDTSLNSINIFSEKYGINAYKLIKDIRGHRSYGCASLAIVKIALGELQGIVSAKLSLWDYAAAIIILNEVGGCYSYFNYEGEDDYPLSPVTFIAAASQCVLDGLNSKLMFYRNN